MKQVLDSYTEYEKRFKVEIYRLAFTLCTLICSIYCYFNFIRGDMLDAIANGTVVVLSFIGLLLLKRKIDIAWIHWIPAVSYIFLYFSSFVGSPSYPVAASLFLCLIFVPALILTLGHLRSIPFLLMIFTFSYYELFIEAGSFMNVVYPENEKQTFMVTGLLL